MTLNERKSLPIWKKIIAFVISFVLFCIQIALLVATLVLYFGLSSNAYQGIPGILFGVSYGIGLAFVLYITSKPISASYKITWAVLILALPLPFCLLYTLNAITKHSSKMKHRKILAQINKELPSIEKLEINNPIDTNLSNLLLKSANAPTYKDCKITFFKDAKEKHEDMLISLRGAKKYILMEYFIISNGKCFEDVLQILKEKSDLGIKTYILYDDVGSKGYLTKKVEKRLGAIKNVNICKFEPVSLSISPLINYRDHRKICVIDGVIAYCGGDNLADEYIHEITRFGYWRDNACKYEGKVVNTFIDLFKEMWFFSSKHSLELPASPEYFYEPQNGYVTVFGDGPVTETSPGYNLFYSLISLATKYVFISTPYLIIDDALLEALSRKAKSGVEVVIMMPGIPDKKAPYYMGRFNYKRLVLAGVKIFEYLPGFNHAKNIIIDDEYAFCGTINMDYRSLFLHYECGSLIMHNKEIYKIKEDFNNSIEKSKEVTLESIKKYPLHQKIIAFILNIFAPFF